MLATISSLVESRASTPGEKEKFPYFDEAMTEYGLDYTWEAHEYILTEDGYFLTMFRIIGDENGNRI